jgi:hypothetical protein
MTDSMPMTRSGKIMRSILRKIISNEMDTIGDTSTLADPKVVDKLIEQVNGPPTVVAATKQEDSTTVVTKYIKSLVVVVNILLLLRLLILFILFTFNIIFFHYFFKLVTNFYSIIHIP